MGSPAKALYASFLNYYLSINQAMISQLDFIRGVQERLGIFWTDQLVEPAAQFFAGARAAAGVDFAYLYSQLNTANLQVLLGLPRIGLNAGVSAMKGYVEAKYSDIVQYSVDTVDYFLPEETKAPSSNPEAVATEKFPQVIVRDQPVVVSTNPSLSCISGRVSKRLRAKALDSIQYVRLLSSTRVKEIIHIDLIAYAEVVIDQIGQHIPVVVSQTQDNLTQAQECASQAVDTGFSHVDNTRQKLFAALESLQISVADGKSLLVSSADLPIVQDIRSAVSPRAEFLRSKLHDAVNRARAASTQASTFVTAHDVQTLSREVTTFFSRVPSLVVSGSVEQTKLLALLQATFAAVTKVFYFSHLSAGSMPASNSQVAVDLPLSPSGSENTTESLSALLIADVQSQIHAAAEYADSLKEVTVPIFETKVILSTEMVEAQPVVIVSTETVQQPVFAPVDFVDSVSHVSTNECLETAEAVLVGAERPSTTPESKHQGVEVVLVVAAKTSTSAPESKQETAEAVVQEFVADQAEFPTSVEPAIMNPEEPVSDPSSSGSPTSVDNQRKNL